MLSDRPSAPPARAARRGVRRDAILAAATEVFAERGFPGATMEEIAERAGLGKGTLYNYFEDKKHLLEAACRETTDGLVRLTERYFAEAAASAAGTRQVFYGLFATLTSYFQEHHAALVVQVREARRMALEGDDAHVDLLAGQRDRLASVIVPTLEAAMRRGHLRELPARPVANLIIGNLHAHLMDVACGGGRPASADLPTETADFLTSVLFDGLLVESP